jgi:PAS domain S-box-containing protein
MAERGKAGKGPRHGTETLRDSRATVESILRAAPVGIGLTINRVFRQVNDRLCEMLGYSREELLGRETRLLYAGDVEYERVGAEIRRQSEAHGAGTIETAVRRKDGQTLAVLLNWALSVPGDPSQGVSFAVLDITERKRAEAALRSVVAGARCILWDADAEVRGDWYDWRMRLHASESTCRDLGLTPAPGQSAGEMWSSHVPPEHHARMNRACDAALRAGAPGYEQEFIFRAANGEERWLREDVRIAQTGPGLFHLVGVCVDITARKRAEEALRESEHKYRALVETTETGFLIVDAQGKVVDANAEYVRLTGHKALTEILGRTVIEWTAPHDRERNAAEVEKCAATSRVRDLVIDYARPDGVITPIEINATVVRTAEGLRILALCRDITQRRRAEEALRESEAKYRNLFEYAKDAIFLADAQTGVILDANPAASRMMRLPREKIVGLHQSQLHPSEEIERYKEIFRNHVAKGAAITGGLFLQRADGQRIPVDISASIVEVAGRPVILGSFRDTTERRRAEEERRQLEARVLHAQKLESLGVLAGGIAHDFNNLLMAIMGNLELAARQLSPVSPAHPYLRNMETACRRAAGLCQQMLAYSGKGRFVIEALSLNDVVREMTHILEVSVSKKAVLKYNLARDLPAIEADANQVRQVLMNLITNAAEAVGEQSGVISVSTGALHCAKEYLAGMYLDEELPEGLYVYAEVADTGCGMTPEVQQRMFEPFFTTKFTGRGLGMAAVLGILRGHKGAVKVYSEPGKGTTLKVLFPASRKAAAADGKAEPAAEWRGAGTVLLVDDEQTIRAVVADMLTAMGFRVVTAANGRQALELYRVHQDEIVCVLLDLTMPEFGGEETFRELRQMNPSVRVILTSGYNEQEVTQRFAGKGLAGFMQKPYALAALKAKLRQAIGG